MKGQLTLSLGKMKKGYDVDDDHYGAVRTGVSQDRVTAILCTEELFLGIQYIALSTYQTSKNVGGGRIRMVNTTHLAVPAGFHTSQLVLYVCGVQGFP
jgi:hypothetical protein